MSPLEKASLVILYKFLVISNYLFRWKGTRKMREYYLVIQGIPFSLLLET